MFYRPKGKAVAADVIPYFENGKYYLFYLKDHRNLEEVGEGCDWQLLVSEDLVHFQEKGIALERGKQNEQDLYVYTGSVIKKDDTYYIFYTGHNNHIDGAEKILLATSKDLIHWEKEKDFCFSSNSDELEINDFRDPFVFYDEKKEEYVMVLTGRYKNLPLMQYRGALLKATSKDLYHWELSEKPFYNPDAYYTHECPDIFKIGDWYYLVFSEFVDRYVTTYRMAKSLEGPWISPKNNQFDGHAFYAAKSAFNGKSRIMFGWNPIKDNELDDNAYWQWGGNIIPHEIYQLDDASLGVRCPKSIKDNYELDLPLDIKVVSGKAEIDDRNILLKGEEKRTFVNLGKLRDNVKIELDITPLDDAGDFGIYLNEKECFDYYYMVRLDPLYQRMIFDKWPRFDRTKYGHVDSERPLEIKKNKKNHIIVLVQGSVLEVYVDDVIAMSERMFEKGENFGIHANLMNIKVENIIYKECKDE